VYDPSLGFVTGGGTVMHNGVPANFAFSAKYLKNGQTQGSLLYLEHRASGDVVLKCWVTEPAPPFPDPTATEAPRWRSGPRS